MRLPGPMDVASSLRDVAIATGQLAGAVGQLVTLLPQVSLAMERIIEVAGAAELVIERITVLAADADRTVSAIDNAVVGVDALLERVAVTVTGIDAMARKAGRTTTKVDEAVAPLMSLQPTLTAVGELDLGQARALLLQLPDLVAALQQVGPDVRSLRARVDDLHHLAVGLPGGKRLLRKGSVEE